MFTPDNEKLKTMVFHLLKKPATRIYKNWNVDNWAIQWCFGSLNNFRDNFCELYVPKFSEKDSSWKMVINVCIDVCINTDVILTEKEAMEIKWQLTDIRDSLVEKIWNKVADFALEENGTQDELLDD